MITDMIKGEKSELRENIKVHIKIFNIKVQIV